jgi:hypothetical protein
MMWSFSKTLLRVVISLVALSAVLYGGDYLAARFHIPPTRELFGSVQVRRYYAVGEKNGKTEFLFNPPETQPCLNSLFPHFRYPPCWYLRRHTEQRTNI